MDKTHLLVNNYSIANPETWQFEKNSEQYGGLEDSAFNSVQQNEIESLGGVWFQSASLFLDWLNGEI